MTKPLHTFRPDSLAARVVNFFQHNPEEELDLEAITDKFDATRGNIHTLLAKAVELGLIVRAQDHDGAYIYRAGKNLPRDVEPLVDATPGKPNPTAKKTRATGYANIHKAIDLNALTVDDNVPFMPRMSVGGHKWQPLFDKLTKPGQSIAFPATMRGAIGAAAAKINRAKTHGNYRVALTSQDTARIWRVA